MRKSTILLSTLGDLYGDLELAVYKLIKNEGKKHIEGVYIDELKHESYIDLSIAEVHGTRAVIVHAVNCDNNHELLNYPLSNLQIDSAMNILVALEDEYGIE